MQYLMSSKVNPRRESIQNMQNIRKVEKEVRELLTETSPDKPPLLPESRPIYYFSVTLQVTSSMIIEFDTFSTKGMIVMKVLLPSLRNHNFIAVREAVFPNLSLRARNQEMLSGIFIKENSILDPRMDIKEFEKNAIKSFGCDWYSTELKCISPRELDKLYPSFFPRTSSLHYKRTRK